MSTQHLGWRSIGLIQDLASLDERWVVWHDDGFTWWSGELAQRVRFEEPDGGGDVWWLSFETDCLRGFGNFSMSPWALAQELNERAGVFVAVAEDDRLRLRGRTPFTAIDAPVGAFQLWERALLSNVAARAISRLPRAKVGFGVCPDASGHPEHGTREEEDELLEAIHEYASPDLDDSSGAQVAAALRAIRERLVGLDFAELPGSGEGAMSMVRQAAPSMAVTVFEDDSNLLGVPGLRVAVTLFASSDVEARPFPQLELNQMCLTVKWPVTAAAGWNMTEVGDLVQSALVPLLTLSDVTAGMVAEDVVKHAIWAGSLLRMWASAEDLEE